MTKSDPNVAIPLSLFNSIVVALDWTSEQDFECDCEPYQERETGAWIHDEDKCSSSMEDHISITLDQVYTIAKTKRPTVVCLCGSTRFWKTYQQAGLQETLAGKIVLSIGAASGTDDDHFGNLPQEEYDRIKVMLDELHLRKIDLADEVLVLNVGGYIGESTRRELEYALSLRKPVRFWEAPND